MEVHWNILWFLDKHSLQYAALFMIDRASALAISKDNAAEKAGDN